MVISYKRPYYFTCQKTIKLGPSCFIRGKFSTRKLEFNQFLRSRWRLARATESLTKEKPNQAALLDRLTQLEQSRPKAASEMANELMLDTEEAVRLGVFNNQWETTIMTASVAGRIDLIETGS